MDIYNKIISHFLYNRKQIHLENNSCPVIW